MKLSIGQLTKWQEKEGEMEVDNGVARLNFRETVTQNNRQTSNQPITGESILF